MNRFMWSPTKAFGTITGPMGAKFSWLLPPYQSDFSAGRSGRMLRSRHETSLVVIHPAMRSSALSAPILLPPFQIAQAISASQSILSMPRGMAMSSLAPASTVDAFRNR